MSYTISDNPDAVFDYAIANGFLSSNPTQPNYAGNYMYMCTEPYGRGGLKHGFKHCDTRQYLFALEAPPMEPTTPAGWSHTDTSTEDGGAL